MAVPYPPGRVVHKEEDPKFIIPRFLTSPVTPPKVQEKRERYLEWMREREAYQMIKCFMSLDTSHTCPCTPPVTPKCSEHPGKTDWETVTLRWRTRVRNFHAYIVSTPEVLGVVKSKMSQSDESPARSSEK